MSSKTTTWAQGLLDLFFLNTAYTLVGDAAGLLPSAAAGSLYLSLHSADPGEAGDQTTSELTYTGYARQAAARSGSGWSRTGKAVSNVPVVAFGNRSDAGAAQTALFVGVGTSSSGAGKLLYRCPIGSISAALACVALGSSNVITIPNNPFAVDAPVTFFGGPNVTLFSGVTEGARVFVRTVSGNDITLGATAGAGSDIDIGTGAGYIAALTGLIINQNINPQLAAGQAVFRED